jgi:glucosylglycerate phosphorylase
MRGSMMKGNHELQSRIKQYLNILYGDSSTAVFDEMMVLIEGWKEKSGGSIEKNWVNQNDVMLITYGDSVISSNEKPLITLQKFLNKYIKDTITAVHLLPMYPYTSDDGFSVVDYYEINDELGTWQDVSALSRDFDMMYDAVVNHISKSSSWFQCFLKCEGKYEDFFIQADPCKDYSMVTRPRALPLLTAFGTREGTKHVWTTFSDDQIDLNFKSPSLLLEIVNVLLYYAYNGARFIRLDAIGFAWKEIGTTCMHLEQTHVLVKLMRTALDLVFPGTILITETNVPHNDNISYFGNGFDEAQMVYQFPLPPLVLFSFLTGNASKLSQWAKSLEATQLSQRNTYFNFLASHDGIGMRPVENILDEEEKEIMLQTVSKHGGNISYKLNSDGSKSPYELNINYLDALTDPNLQDMKQRVDKFMAAQSILLSVVGVPGIYIHSLLGSQNWYEGVVQSGIYRRINREKLDFDRICKELEDVENIRNMVFSRFSKLIKLRRQQSAFAPQSAQNMLFLDNRAFALIRQSKENERILAIVNVSSEEYSIQEAYKGVDIINDEMIDGGIKMLPYQTRWIRL